MKIENVENNVSITYNVLDILDTKYFLGNNDTIILSYEKACELALLLNEVLDNIEYNCNKDY